MSSSLLLRLVFVLLVALATEVHLISGLELEEARGPFEERVSSIGRSSYPQIYNLHLEPVRKGASSFNVVQPNKRSRLFVGKRMDDDYLSGDDGDLVLLSDDNNDEPFDLKRNHLFVGRRASPRFVGKRSVVSQPLRMTRKRRFASNEYGRDGKMEDSDEGRVWKLWMTAGTGEEGSTAAYSKRARLFVGKRHELEADDKKRSRLFVGRRAEADEEADDKKRSRLFVGRRAEADEEADKKRSRLFVGRRAEADEEADDKKRSRLFVGRRAEADEEEDEEKRNSGIAVPAVVELSNEAAKRARLFVGKRHSVDHPSSPSADSFSTEKGPGEIHPPARATEEEADKRVHLFPGKRPAPSFVGKRED